MGRERGNSDDVFLTKKHEAAVFHPKRKKERGDI